MIIIKVSFKAQTFEVLNEIKCSKEGIVIGLIEWQSNHDHQLHSDHMILEITKKVNHI